MYLNSNSTSHLNSTHVSIRFSKLRAHFWKNGFEMQKNY
jgi:hypothetical protein